MGALGVLGRSGPPFPGGDLHTHREETAGWSKAAGASSRHGFKNPSFPSDPNALAGDPAMAHPAAHDKALVTRRRRPAAAGVHVHGHPHPASHCTSAPLPADASRCVRGSGLKVREGEGQWQGRRGGGKGTSHVGPLPEGPGAFHSCCTCLNIYICDSL